MSNIIGSVSCPKCEGRGFYYKDAIQNALSLLILSIDECGAGSNRVGMIRDYAKKILSLQDKGKIFCFPCGGVGRIPTSQHRDELPRYKYIEIKPDRDNIMIDADRSAVHWERE